MAFVLDVFSPFVAFFAAVAVLGVGNAAGVGDVKVVEAAGSFSVGIFFGRGISTRPPVRVVQSSTDWTHCAKSKSQVSEVIHRAFLELYVKYEPKWATVRPPLTPDY